MASQEYKALLDEAWDLHVRKNAGYAGAENPDPWANFRMCEAFGIPAFEGCMVRLSDKYIRITNLMRSADNDKVGESIRDTLQDLAAYALIAICLLDEKKKVVEPSLTDMWDRELARGAVVEPYQPVDLRALPLEDMCAHPLDKRYISVAGTTNCHICYKVLSEAPNKCTECYRPEGSEHTEWCSYHPLHIKSPNPWGDA